MAATATEKLTWPAGFAVVLAVKPNDEIDNPRLRRAAFISALLTRRSELCSEKPLFAIVAETYEPGVTVSLVARRHGVAPN